MAFRCRSGEPEAVLIVKKGAGHWESVGAIEDLRAAGTTLMEEVMTIARPVFSLKDFLHLLENVDPCPFYAALLYTPMNGLDGKLHQYVVTHWDMLNKLTGDSNLLMAVENPWGKSIDQFKPEEVYDIGRNLGAETNDVPCLILFTDPNDRQDTLILRLREFLSPADAVTDESLTDFFRSLQSIVERSVHEESESRLQHLRAGLDHEWPPESKWALAFSQAGNWILTAAAAAPTIAKGITAVMGLFR